MSGEPDQGGPLEPADGEVVGPQAGAEAGDAPEEAFLVGASFRAPLPPPAMLEDYNHVLPGLAERIVRMAESDQQHAHWLDQRYLRLRFTGQIAAFVIAMGGLVAGTYLIATGHDVTGLATLFGGLGPVVAAFLYRQIRSARANGAE